MTVRHLKSLQALDLAIRLGSLKAAAEALSITPAAAGQRIKTLEKYLGIELLVRGRMGLRPSPELAGAIDPLKRAFSELDQVANILEMQQANEIHIAADSDWVDLWLSPKLKQFQSQFPNIVFCINGEGQTPKRIRRADCAIRFGPIEADELQDVLFHDYLVPMGSAENESRVMALPKSSRLDGFPFFHLDFYKNDPNAVTWPSWLTRHGYGNQVRERGLRFQRIIPAVEAASSDAGFIIGGIALLGEKIKTEALVLPFAETGGVWTEHAFCAKFESSALLKPAIRQFRLWLVEQAAQTRDWTVEIARTRSL
jgi:LysR family glycine cleavage system transcriptional activator